MNFQLELLSKAVTFNGVKEVPGAEDNPVIVQAHKLCGIKDQKFEDEIPWCSSFMNLWVLLTCFKYAPTQMTNLLKQKGFDDISISAYAGLADGEIHNLFNLPIKDQSFPTFSAAAKSWANWGQPIKDEPQLGDLVVFRRDGGHHVALFLARNALFVTVFGANQSNKVCVSETFLRSRVIAYRRFL